MNGEVSVNNGISRRDFLGILAAGCAGLLSPAALAGDFQTTRVPGGPVRQGQALSEARMRLLRSLADTIIPRTDTPGAADTDTHGFIDDQLANCRAHGEASRFIADLDAAGMLTERQWGREFPDLAAEEQLAAMTAIAHNASPFDSLAPDFFTRLKTLTMLGYYSSREGASEELVYLPVPGGYDGNFKVSDSGGKAFSPPVI